LPEATRVCVCVCLRDRERGSRAADTDREVWEEGSERETDTERDSEYYSVRGRVACC
jgi:hypothetical protein